MTWKFHGKRLRWRRWRGLLTSRGGGGSRQLRRQVAAVHRNGAVDGAVLLKVLYMAVLRTVNTCIPTR